jgi:Putative MetA-pathway of phenol degradation
MRSTYWIWAALIATAVIGASGSPAVAQDLEPRAYSAAPLGTTFLVLGVGRSSGDVFIDPSLPLEEVHATLGAATAGVGYTFDLFTRTALVLATMPYARGKASGRIDESSREATRTGWADARVKLSVNLLGGRARGPREFIKAPRSTIVGASLTTVAPTGQYHGDRLVNLGSNRWSFKPELGVSVPVRGWHLDAYAGIWLFSVNDQFYPGTARREQDRVTTIQGHASYTIRPRLWMAFDATWYSGGTTTVDGIRKADLQRNSRVGATVSVPLGGRQSLKGSYSAGATTRIGGDFKTVAVVWQVTWIR